MKPNTGTEEAVARPVPPEDPRWLAEICRAGYLPTLEALVLGTGAGLGESLEFLVRAIEAQCEGTRGSILLLDPDTGVLRNGAGASLPRFYRDAVDGLEIGPEVGCCGAAAFLRKRVIVPDIASDPKWAPYLDYARRANLGACWSEPIIGSNGEVLGTFAMYYDEPRHPDEDSLLVTEAAAHLARVAIERHRAQEEVEKSRRLEAKLLEAQRLESLGLMAGGIAHDFNNLLAGILGNADYVLEAYRGDDPKLAEALAHIRMSATRAAELSGQLLAYTGRGGARRETIDLVALLGEVSALLEHSLPSGVTLALETAEEPLLLRGDPSQIRQVVLNLTLNAAESLQEGQGEVVLRAFPASTSEGAREVVLEVEDSGCGMDAATRERIFDPFFTTKFTGRGLGLAAVQGIVRAHGGAIEVDTEPGRGSRFRLRLPSTRGTSAERREQRPTPVVEAVARDGTILVVDDEESVRVLVGKALERSGYRVLLAGDGRTALDLFKRNRDSIRSVLLDMTMPDRSGGEVLREFLRIKPDLRFALMSGYGERETRESCLRHGACPSDDPPCPFLRKPFTLRELDACIAQTMARP